MTIAFQVTMAEKEGRNLSSYWLSSPGEGHSGHTMSTPSPSLSIHLFPTIPSVTRGELLSYFPDMVATFKHGAASLMSWLSWADTVAFLYYIGLRGLVY